MSDLYGELRSAAEQVHSLHLSRLRGLGVSWETIAELGRHSYGLGVANAIEHPSEPGLYCLDPAGAPHLVLPVFDAGELIDLVAFRSSAPNDWLLRTGLGWALGLERGLERHTWGDPVNLAVSPLEWLQQGATGLCVLDWDAPEVPYLTGVPHLVCSTETQAALLRKSLARPVRFPTISVMEAALAA